MADGDTLERRLEAVERALTDGDHAVADLEDAAELADRVGTVEDELRDLGEQVDELDAATQALRGYVGNVRSVNRDVEQRADAAIAAVDRLESQLDDDSRSDAERPISTDTDRSREATTEQLEPNDTERPVSTVATDSREPSTETSGEPIAGSPRRQPRERCDACGRPEREHPTTAQIGRRGNQGYDTERNPRKRTEREYDDTDPIEADPNDTVPGQTVQESTIIERVRNAL